MFRKRTFQQSVFFDNNEQAAENDYNYTIVKHLFQFKRPTSERERERKLGREKKQRKTKQKQMNCT